MREEHEPQIVAIEPDRDGRGWKVTCLTCEFEGGPYRMEHVAELVAVAHVKEREEAWK